MLCTLGIIQGGVWLHGRNVVQEAATAAADVARSTSGGESQARQAAMKIAEVGGLSEVQISVRHSTTSVRVRVTASAPMIFDIGLGRITETAEAPMERVTDP